MNELNKPAFDISVRGDELHVKRSIELPAGWIHLDLTYKHKDTPRNELTLKQVHESSIEIALIELQRMLEASRKSSDSQ